MPVDSFGYLLLTWLGIGVVALLILVYLIISSIRQDRRNRVSGNEVDS